MFPIGPTFAEHSPTVQSIRNGERAISYDILKSPGLDRFDTRSPDFLKTLERMQREVWESPQTGVRGYSVDTAAVDRAFE